MFKNENKMILNENERILIGNEIVLIKQIIPAKPQPEDFGEFLAGYRPGPFQHKSREEQTPLAAGKGALVEQPLLRFDKCAPGKINS